MSNPLSWRFYLLLLCLIDSAKALSESVSRAHWHLSTSTGRLASGRQAVVDLVRRYLPQAAEGKLTIWDMVQITALCGVIPGFWYLQRQLRRKYSDTGSWKSTSKLKKGVAVNEEDSGSKYTSINKSGNLAYSI
jgi:hypothetical protein